MEGGSPAAILSGVGYNPYRKYRASAGDYVFVAMALLVALGLLAWAVFG